MLFVLVDCDLLGTDCDWGRRLELVRSTAGETEVVVAIVQKPGQVEAGNQPRSSKVMI